jgi:ABC-type branched-subunit amino acid transport system permease subunit
MKALNQNLFMRAGFYLAVFLVAFAGALRASPIAVQSFVKNPDGVTLTMSPGKMKLTVCSDSIVRVMYSPWLNAAGGTRLRGDEPFIVHHFLSRR